MRRLTTRTSPKDSSCPAEVLQCQAGIPDLRHVRDLVAFELHDVDVIRTHAASRRGNRTALARMGAMEYTVSGDVVAGTIRRERLQLIMSVEQDGQHALHPVR